jgi:hypothetical protein
LQRLGAVALKNSVYVLPASEETLEDFQWLAHEIVDDGGEGTVCESAFVEGMTDDGMRRLFRDASDEEYRAIAHDARAVAQGSTAGGSGATQAASDRSAAGRSRC